MCACGGECVPSLQLTCRSWRATHAQNADAVRHFSACIALDDANHVFWSNRSAAHAALGDWDSAWRDAERTTTLSPAWAKGWARRGAAAMGREAFTDAREAYAKATELEPENEAYRKARHG